MLKLGIGLGGMGSSEMHKLDQWADHFPDIPSNERVGQVCGAIASSPTLLLPTVAAQLLLITSFMPAILSQLIDIDEVPSLEDFLSIFDAPVDLSMEADRVWPPERAMVY